MNINAIVIGFGPIGQEVCRRVRTAGWNVKYVGRTTGTYRVGLDGQLISPPLPPLGSFGSQDLIDLSDVQIAFLTIPASFEGKVARDYLALLLRAGIPVVTCEKSALAYYPSYLSSELGAGTASVGGGIHMLPFLRERYRARKDIVAHIVLNASLNCIFSERNTLEMSIKPARELHLIEPGEHTTLAVLNGEIVDAFF